MPFIEGIKIAVENESILSQNSSRNSENADVIQFQDGIKINMNDAAGYSIQIMDRAVAKRLADVIYDWLIDLD